MSDEWKQPAPLWVRAAPLAVVIVGIVAAFVYTEMERSKQGLDQDLHLIDVADGTSVAVEVLAPHVTSDHWERIASLKSLRGIDLSEVRTVDKGIERLSSLPDLRSLELNGRTFVDDALIEQLADVPTLKRLAVRGCRNVTDESVVALIGWKSLEGVDLAGTSITLPGLVRLREARRDLMIVASLPAAGYMEAPDSYGSQEGSFRLNTQADVDTLIEALDVPHNWRTGRWREDPRRQFGTLRLSGDAAGAALPEFAAVLNEVKSLSIHESRIAGNVGNWSSELKSLEIWTLADGSDLSGFAHCSSLTSITLHADEQLRAVNLEWIAELPNLRDLSVSGISLTLADMESISQTSSLETLYFTDFTGTNISPLLVAGRLPKLRRLSLWNHEFDSATQTQLRSAHPTAHITGEGMDLGAANESE